MGFTIALFTKNAGILLFNVALITDDRVQIEGRRVFAVWSSPPQSLGHGPYMMGGCAAAGADIIYPQLPGLKRIPGHFMPCENKGVKFEWKGNLSIKLLYLKIWFRQ